MPRGHAAVGQLWCPSAGVWQSGAALPGLGGVLGRLAGVQRCWSGQLPCPAAVGEAEGEQPAQVERGDAVVEPGVVLLDPAVGHASVAAGEPGDGAFDHGPVGPVGGLERLVGGPLPVVALQLVVHVQAHGPSLRGGGAARCERAAAAGGPEGRGPLGRQGAGDPVRAGQGAGRSVVGEVVDGEPARHCRPERPWLEERRPFPLVEGGEHVAGGVGGVTEHLDLAGLLVDGGIGGDQVRPDGGVAVVRPGGLGQPDFGDQPGVRFDHHVGLEPVPVLLAGLVGVPGVGVDGGDHPVRRGPPGDPPPPVGAVGALGRFDVLAGHQRQQRHRFGRLPTLGLDRVEVQSVQQGEGVADQRGHQLVTGGRVVPRDRRLPGLRVVLPGQRRQPGATLDDHLGCAGHLAAHPTDLGDQLGHRVLAGHRIVEDRGVQRPPPLPGQHTGLRRSPPGPRRRSAAAAR